MQGFTKFDFKKLIEFRELSGKAFLGNRWLTTVGASHEAAGGNI